MMGVAMQLAGRWVVVVLLVVRAVARNLRPVFTGAMAGHERPEPIGERDSLAEEQQQRNAPSAWRVKYRGTHSHQRLFQFSAGIA